MATARMPSSLQAQITRRAISPRLAISIFLNILMTTAEHRRFSNDCAAPSDAMRRPLGPHRAGTLGRAGRVCGQSMRAAERSAGIDDASFVAECVDIAILFVPHRERVMLSVSRHGYAQIPAWQGIA